ncbi:MAG TPA: signal peptide peptidase SppA [Planctomycetaceae bacterium]|nr:signal peptide peptidase SppA [Planctomycetaceae bacterium]
MTQPVPASPASPQARDDRLSEPAAAPSGPVIVVQQDRGRGRVWLTRLLAAGLVAALVWVVVLQSNYSRYFGSATPPIERFHSGDRGAVDKIALVEIRGTIMPPFTDRILKAIRYAADDDQVKGVVLLIDSPGGLVADSHEIYHRLRKLGEKKPVYAAMRRLAASGGYYVAMGVGPKGVIFAEPTTWTGSIGVIIPRYELQELAKNVGVKATPLKTGEFKDALSPFKEMTAAERELWTAIMQDAFGKFLDVIVENRPELRKAELAEASVGSTHQALVSLRSGPDPTQNLATGQIFTAEQAVAAGLVDRIGFLDEAVEALQGELKLDRARVVKYEFPQGLLMDLVFGEGEVPNANGLSPVQWQALIDTAVPRAWYHFSALPGLPSSY